MYKIGDGIDRIVSGLECGGESARNVSECGASLLPLEDSDRQPGVTYCDGTWHHVANGVSGRCQIVRQREVKDRVAGERRRLAAEIAKVEEASAFGFDGYDGRLCVGGARALEVMRRFARAPQFSVLLKGPRGLGKTHLLLASHFELLERGIPSVYVRTPELRRLFRAMDSYDQEVVDEARRKLDPILYAAAIHFDDAGHIENDARARGQFAEGLKDLLDRSRGRWATATNRSGDEAERHPDLSSVNFSRLLLDAEVVVMSGDDFRALTARTA
jgi:DNA replication protein DnaC